jgi:hypothetical protein
MVACVHVALALRLKLKKRENHYWYLQVYGLVSVLLSFGWLQKIQDCVMEEEEFEGLED